MSQLERIKEALYNLNDKNSLDILNSLLNEIGESKDNNIELIRESVEIQKKNIIKFSNIKTDMARNIKMETFKIMISKLREMDELDYYDDKISFKALIRSDELEIYDLDLIILILLSMYNDKYIQMYIESNEISEIVTIVKKNIKIEKCYVDNIRDKLNQSCTESEVGSIERIDTIYGSKPKFKGTINDMAIDVANEIYYGAIIETLFYIFLENIGSIKIEILPRGNNYFYNNWIDKMNSDYTENMETVKKEIKSLKIIKKEVSRINERIIEIMTLILAAFSIIGFNIYSLNASISFVGVILLNVSLAFILSLIFMMIDWTINKVETDENYKRNGFKKNEIATIVTLILLISTVLYFDNKGYLNNNTSSQPNVKIEIKSETETTIK